MLKTTLAYTAVFLLWLAVPAPFATAATYCVAPHGDDSHAGTESQPWKTLRKAVVAVQPGDTVRIRAGEYFVGPTWIVNRAGTAESPVTHRAFGDGQVRSTGSSRLAPEKWTRVKGSIYSTRIDQPIMAVFRNAYPLHRPGDRAKIFSVDDMIPNSSFRRLPTGCRETHSRYAAPQLVGPADAHLQTDSPAIDVGVAQNEVTVDIEGVARAQGAACDIGAYEFKVNTK